MIILYINRLLKTILDYTYAKISKIFKKKSLFGKKDAFLLILKHFLHILKVNCIF
jgi:hypothetical protein